MPTLKSNELAVRYAKAGICKEGKNAGQPQAVEYVIEGITGFVLRVEPSGKGAYYMRYRADGKVRRFRIGARELMKFSDAKSQATKLAEAIDRGEDPRAVQLARAETRTLRELWDDRKADQRDELSVSTVENYDSVMRQYVDDALGDKAAGMVTTPMVASILRDVASQSKHRAHMLGCMLSSTYKWAKDKGLVSSNPLDGIKFTHKAKARKRRVEGDEIGKLWAGIDGAPGVTTKIKTAIKILLLTGQRSKNLREARAKNLKTLDAANPRWVISGDDMKRKAEDDHVVPLGPVTVELFKTLVDGLNDPDALLFPAKGKGGSVPIERQTISHAMRDICETLGLEDFHAHDFRKAFGTWAGEQLIPKEVREAIEHHKDRGTNATYYNFARLEGPMRDALVRWEQYVVRCVSGDEGKAGDDGKVVRLAKAKCA